MSGIITRALMSAYRQTAYADFKAACIKAEKSDAKPFWADSCRISGSELHSRLFPGGSR